MDYWGAKVYVIRGLAPPPPQTHPLPSPRLYLFEIIYCVEVSKFCLRQSDDSITMAASQRFQERDLGPSKPMKSLLMSLRYPRWIECLNTEACSLLEDSAIPLRKATCPRCAEGVREGHDDSSILYTCLSNFVNNY